MINYIFSNVKICSKCFKYLFKAIENWKASEWSLPYERIKMACLQLFLSERSLPFLSMSSQWNDSRFAGTAPRTQQASQTLAPQEKGTTSKTNLASPNQEWENEGIWLLTSFFSVLSNWLRRSSTFGTRFFSLSLRSLRIPPPTRTLKIQNVPCYSMWYSFGTILHTSTRCFKQTLENNYKQKDNDHLTFNSNGF